MDQKLLHFLLRGIGLVQDTVVMYIERQSLFVVHVDQLVSQKRSPFIQVFEVDRLGRLFIQLLLNLHLKVLDQLRLYLYQGRVVLALGLEFKVCSSKAS